MLTLSDSEQTGNFTTHLCQDRLPGLAAHNSTFLSKSRGCFYILLWCCSSPISSYPGMVREDFHCFLFPLRWTHSLMYLLSFFNLNILLFMLLQLSELFFLCLPLPSPHPHSHIHFLLMENILLSVKLPELLYFCYDVLYFSSYQNMTAMYLLDER